jgi:predicted phosphodiesterase
MAIAFIGDIHGDYYALQLILNEIAQRPEITAVIQVGDWGWYDYRVDKFKALTYPVPTYWVDGNHEDFTLLPQGEGPQEIAPNCYYMPRGSVLMIDGRKVAFMGGAGSVDAAYNHQWSELENILPQEIAKLNGVTGVDILVTHCPPQSTIQKHFDPHNLMWFGLPVTWKDPNADKIEALWKNLDYPQLICGHMHKQVTDYRVRILNINELFCL